MEPAATSQPKASLALYRPRQARASPLYQLFEAHYEEVKALWEERFEKAYGFWRGFIDKVVARYLDCGTGEGGFARLRCEECHLERLLTFSCRPRGICPSCDAKRAAAFAALLHDEVLEDVPHQMWVFTIPRMLRVYFLHHRELLGELSRIAYETVQELMATACFEDDSFRPGMVSVVQTFGEAARFHPHVHGLCSRGGWNARGEWIPVPYIDTQKAEQLFRHRVMGSLRDKGLLSEQRIKLLLSWRKSGFSIDDSVRIPAGEQPMLERVARYMLRAPVSLSRLRWARGDGEVFYAAKRAHDDPEHPSIEGQRLDTLEFLARVIAQIPEPRRHLVCYYGHYAHVVRGRRRKSQTQRQVLDQGLASHPYESTLSPQRKAALRRRWAHLIRRVFEVDPLVCPQCAGPLRVVAFITEPRVIRKILDHLKKRNRHNRAPPQQPPLSLRA